MDADGGLKNDVKVPEGELGTSIKNAFKDIQDQEKNKASSDKALTITVIAAMGEEQAMSFRPSGGQ